MRLLLLLLLVMAVSVCDVRRPALMDRR